VLFLGACWTARQRRTLDRLLAAARRGRTRFVAVVSTFAVHLGDHEAAALEAHVSAALAGLPTRVVVFRPGHVLSRRSRTSGWLRRLAGGYPLVPARMHSCFVDGDELFAAIENERQRPPTAGQRVYTLLGGNRPWRDVLAQHRSGGIGQTALAVIATVLGMLMVGRLAGLVLDALARRRPPLRRWNPGILRPASFRELLSLYNPYNFGHVKVVGYNNGVVHFGHAHPGKTIVSTVNCQRIVRRADDRLTVDCGATIRQAAEFLASLDRELPVIPNYSYVCLGTAFFVPIHGSASDVTTVAETITRVVLYDPALDRLLVADREDAAFREHLYRPDTAVLLLRLHCRVKRRARYVVRRERWGSPSAAQLLDVLRDRTAANVEIRKGRAGSRDVEVARYYRDAAAEGEALAVPRDALGSLWDRLEANPVSAFLFHALVRRCAWHVELFFTPEQFATFWATHAALPVRKIQLRCIRRDGFPHSPFRDSDCVSADMFMLRKHRHAFEAYLQQTFGTVRANPGKHSA